MATTFTFKRLEEGYDVVHRGKSIGTIMPMKEATGRHCFYLGMDTRKEPRTYRGRNKAAEALLAISKLIEDSKKKKLTPEEIIIRAWDDRPRASDQW